jgi:trimethylamine:corrinoid methyltransferase-like protein
MQTKAKPRLRALRRKEVGTVHDATMEVLKKTGVQVTHPFHDQPVCAGNPGG